MEVLKDIQIPKTARAAILTARDKPYEILDNQPVALPGPGEVLIKLRVSGVCHSDTIPRKESVMASILPLIGGHEGIGIVIAHGEGVKNPQLGSRVGIRWDANACGHCELCISGHEPSCPENQYYGFRQNGTFQDYIIAKSNFAVPIPEGISDVQAAPLMCAGITVYKGLKVGRPLAGTWVCFPGGGGGLGHLGIQFAKAFGCKVIAIDSPDKEALCKKCGADAFIDFTKSKDVVADVIAATDGGPQTTLVTSNASSAYTQAMIYTRALGTVVLIGLGMVQFPSAVVVGKQLTLIGSHTGTRLDALDMLAFVQQHKVKVEVEERKLDRLEESLQQLEAAKVSGRVVLRISE